MNMLNLSIAVTAAAVLVLLIKLLFGNQITPRGHMRLWLLVAVSFIFSPIAEFMPESGLAVRNWLPQSESTVETVWVEPYEDLNARGFAIEEQGNYYIVQKNHLSLRVPFSDKTLDAEFAATTSRAKLENWLWFAGAVLTGIWMLTGNCRQKRKLKALPDSRDAALLAELEAVKVLVGVNDKVRICIKEGVETTFLTRMRGQYVIALESGFDAAERRQVLLHELTHLKHGDLGGNQSAALILAICWWNPVIWLAFRRFRRDMEIYCDYDAARLSGDKKAYAATLVKAAAGTERFVLGTTSFIGGEKEASARVKALAAFKKPKTWIAAAAVLALVIGCVCFVLNPVGQNTQANRAALAEAYDKLLAVNSAEAQRTTNLSYGVLSGARTRETAHLQQTESPLCILGTRTLEELGAEDAAQADTDYTFTYYLTGTRGGTVRTYIRSVDSTLGQGWIDYGSKTLRGETIASGYDGEPSSYGQDDLLGNLRQCLKAAAESDRITRKGNAYQVTMPQDWQLFCAIAANQGLGSVLSTSGIELSDLWNEAPNERDALYQSVGFTMEMDEETMLPRSYTLDFTRTCELIRERIEAEYDSLGAAVVRVDITSYDAFSEPDYSAFGGEKAFREMLAAAKSPEAMQAEQSRSKADDPSQAKR